MGGSYCMSEEHEKLFKVEIPTDKNQLAKQIQALEYVLSNDVNEKDKKIHSEALKDLQEALLYKSYLELQSKEWKSNIINYEPFIESGHRISIKVNFKNDTWLRVYRGPGGEIEWY